MTFLIPSACGLALLVGGVVTVNPAVNQNQAHAEGWLDQSGDTTPSIALSFPTEGLPEGFENTTNQITAVNPGEVTYRSNIFAVTANNYKNFIVTLSSMNGYGSELHGKDNPSATITGVGENVTPDNFGNNTWGYAVTDNLDSKSEETLQYNNVPEYSTGSKVISSYRYQHSDELNTPKKYKIIFAAKIGGDSPADHYRTQVALSITGTPGEVSKLYGIDTMQEMTKSICENTNVGDTKQLEDTRDRKSNEVGTGTKYWVAKLADGNCWMTQNLDFNIPSDGKLYTETSDVTQDTTLTGITRIGSTGNLNSWSTKDTRILAYYDPGLMLKTNPATTQACGVDDTTITSLSNSACINNGWLNVSTGYVAKDIAPEGNMLITTSASNNVLDGTTYDAHYLSGNYYSWNLATAGTGYTSGQAASWASGTQAPSSICPKGWKLPTTGNKLGNNPNDPLAAGNIDSYDVSGSFAYLLRQYGLATGYNGGVVSTDDYTIYDAPLYFLRAGTVNRIDGTTSGQKGVIYGAGLAGHYWSSVNMDSNSAAYLSFTDPHVNPSGGRYLFFGNTVRCVNDPSI